MDEKLTTDDNRLVIETKMIECVKIWPNKGQIEGVPTNPRFIRDHKFEALKKSINDHPEYLNVRPIIVIPWTGEYIVLMGNMRLRAAVDCGFTEIPCIVLNPLTPPDKLRAYLIKDNISYGSDDYDLLANDFDLDELNYWGMDIPHADPPSEDDNKEPGLPDVKLQIIFNGDVDKYDEIKDKIFKITSKYQGLELKG